MTYLFDIHFTRSAPRPGESSTGHETVVGRAKYRDFAVKNAAESFRRRYQSHRKIISVTDYVEAAANIG